MAKAFPFSMLMFAAMMCFATVALAVTTPQVQQRLLQPIIVNGQQAQGLILFQNGVPQIVTCPDAQPYSAADGTSTGWACYDVTPGTWLLNAQPPSQSVSPNPYYPVPAPFYDYFGYSYPPDVYHPYGYPPTIR